MNAELVAMTAEDDRVEGYHYKRAAHATTIEVPRIHQKCEAKAEACEQDMHRRIRETKTQES